MPSTEHEGLVQALLSGPSEPSTIDEFRTNFPMLVGSSGLAPGRRRSDETIAGVPCVRISGSDEQLLLWVHGGGLVAGTAAAHAAPLSHLFADVATVVVDYRLAPEYPLPAALDDVVAVYRSLVASHGGRIVVGGDSAGAGLALLAATTLLAAGEPAPAGLALISPWTDFGADDGVADLDGLSDPLVSREALRGMAAAFSPGDPDTWLLSRYEVSALPPVHIEYGGREVLRADAGQLADRLDREGVEVTSVLTGGLIHVYPILLPTSPEGRLAGERLTRFITSTSKEHQ